MGIWAGMLLAPLLVLADQSVAYALVPWGCNYQHGAVLHVVHLFFLAIVVGCAVASGLALRAPVAPSASVERHRGMALIALLTALLSALVILAMWIPHWALSPCFD